MRTAIWLRRGSQGISLLAFLALLVHSLTLGSADANATALFGLPISFFLDLDPLTALATVVATHELYRNLALALLILVPTFFFGRFFCGWICPFGTLHHVLSWFLKKNQKRALRLSQNAWRPYQRLKYLILTAFLGAAFFTSLHVGLLDPIALLTRSLALAVLPAISGTLQGAGWSLAHTSLGFLEEPALLLSQGLSALSPHEGPVHFQGAFLVGLLFLLALAANGYAVRFWCRGLCPLGALLGLASRTAIFGLEKRESSCTHCRICALSCQGADDPEPGRPWRQSECHLCLNCTSVCPEGGIAFRFLPHNPPADVKPGVDVTRRATLLTLAAGAAAVPVFRAEAITGRGRDPELIRPPGSASEKDFLARCIRCGACMNVCPNTALHPTSLQAGFEGLWTPILVPRIGYCEPTCVLCGIACPTGAINTITPEEKGWTPMKGQRGPSKTPIRIGTAFYDLGRCLPWAMATECIVCEEWCPTSPKAIYFEEAEVLDSDGQPHLVKRPHIDPRRCVGCGACSYACPITGAPAVYVLSNGESRHPEQRMLVGKG